MNGVRTTEPSVRTKQCPPPSRPPSRAMGVAKRPTNSPQNAKSIAASIGQCLRSQRGGTDHHLKEGTRSVQAVTLFGSRKKDLKTTPIWPDVALFLVAEGEWGHQKAFIGKMLLNFSGENLLGLNCSISEKMLSEPRESINILYPPRETNRCSPLSCVFCA